MTVPAQALDLFGDLRHTMAATPAVPSAPSMKSFCVSTTMSYITIFLLISSRGIISIQYPSGSSIKNKCPIAGFFKADAAHGLVLLERARVVLDSEGKR